MRIGPVVVTTVRKQKDWSASDAAGEYLRSPEARQLIARVARSEAKDYIQDKYEDAEVPFQTHEGTAQ